MKDNTLHRFLESFMPGENREWFFSLISQFPRDELEIFVADRSAEELSFLFSWIPCWSPPEGKAYLDFGASSLLPIYPRSALRLGLKEQMFIRRMALDIAGAVADPWAAAFNILKWVNTTIEWDSQWGVRSPSEIFESKKGSCLHLAQLVVSLQRSLFLPCRLVESISLVPDDQKEQELECWNALPDMFMTWQEHGIWSHVFCEVLIDGTWVPMDPSSGQFGLHDIQQHLRSPEYLKFLVRTFPDNEEAFALSDRYILGPLESCNDLNNSVLRSSLAKIASVVTGNILNCSGKTREVQREISAVRSTAEQRTLQRRNRIVADHVFARKIEEQYIMAAQGVETPIVDKYIVSVFPPPKRENFFDECLDDSRSVNRHYIVILGCFPSEEKISRDALRALGYDLGDWVVPPGQDPLMQVRIVGEREQETPLYCDIHIPFTRAIVSCSAQGKRKVVLAGVTGEIIALKILLGNTVVSFIPRALIGGASPHVYGILTSNHRRILGVLIN